MRRQTVTLSSGAGHVKVDHTGVYLVRFDGYGTTDIVTITIGSSSTQANNSQMLLGAVTKGSRFKVSKKTSNWNAMQGETYVFAIAGDYVGAKTTDSLEVIGPIS